ncbi:MAG: glycosyltransferase [Clostridia bacterium]|nr:glycosyltransferase [Clostridia bacterium]
MKIAEVITDTVVGGAEKQVLSLVSGLAGEFEFKVYYPEQSAVAPLVRALPVESQALSLSHPEKPTLADTFLFREVFRREMPDAVHTHAGLSARIGARLSGVPLTISTRHCAYGANNPRPAVPLRGALYNAVTTLTVSTAKAATEDLRAEGVDMRRVVTVQNGVAFPGRLPYTEKSRLLSSLGFPENCFVIGGCGRLEDIKGFDILLRAGAAVAPRCPEMRFLIVGDGTKRRALETQAEAAGIAPICRFVGFLEDPAPYENLFSVNVNPSRGTETSCLVTSECMALGIPTLASDFGGNPEMVENGVNGYLFPSGNAAALADLLVLLYTNRPLLRLLSHSSMQTYRRRFSRRRMLSDYRRIFDKLAGRLPS